MRTLIKTDRNGTKYWNESTCPKCGGTGRISYYSHVEGGVCFLCGGSGVHDHKIIERTPEYEEKLRIRRLERARKTAPERNKKYFKSIGCSEEGKTWIAVGNTYEIKDDLKEAGAKWDYDMGWHFDRPVEKFDVVEFDFVGSEFYHEYEDGSIHVDLGGEFSKFMKEFKLQHAPKLESNSDYIGEVKDRITCDIKEFRQLSSWETQYGVTYLYEFKTEEDNVLIWKTGIWIDDNENVKSIIGTVKSHKEFRGIKQTELTRCKITTE